MKRFIIFLLIICSFQLVTGQHFTQHKQKRVPEYLKVVGVYTASILLDAAGDALNDKGEKQWGHLCNAASVGVLLTSPFIIDYDKSKWGWYLSSYVCLRIATFDYTYNAVRGLPLNYIGNTSLWDKGMQKLNPPGTLFARTCFFTVGFTIPINELTPTNRMRVTGKKPIR